MKYVCSTAALFAASVSAGVASTLLTPSSISLDVGSTFSTYVIGHLNDNSGLSGAATGANYSTVSHVTNGSTAWVTNQFGADYYAPVSGPAPVITMGLGGTYHVSDLVLWGYGGNNNEAKTYQVEFSTDGVTFGDAVIVSNRRVGNNQETLSLGGSHEASHVRLTITDNHFGTAGPAGGDRVGLGEVKFIGADRPLVNASLGMTYSYTTMPTFSGGTFYRDDSHPGYGSPGAFGTGDLTDGATHPNGSAPTTGTINSIVGWGDPASIATDITFDLGDSYFVPENIILGTHIWTAFQNGAPNSVTVRSSLDGVTFTDLVTAAIGAPAGDGHWDIAVPVSGSAPSRYVQLSFDGGAVSPGSVNKWMLDEITILASVPEPSRAMLLLLGVAGFALRRRR